MTEAVMSHHRERVRLTACTGLLLLLAGCAAVPPTGGYGSAYDWSFITTRLNPNWWYSRVGLNLVTRDGAGSRVAIVDTGMLKLHEDFNAATVETGTEFCTAAEGPATDTNGHGTALAGIVVGMKNGHATTGVAPAATLIPYKVVCGTAATVTVFKGVQRAVNATPKPDVLLLALGPWPGDTDASGQSLDDLLKVLVPTHRDTLFVVASVWDPQYIKRPDWTNNANVILVAAMTLNAGGTEVPYSAKRGDIWAPGMDVGTAWIFPKNANPHDQFLMQGTSAAAAIVAGCAALVKQVTGLTGQQLQREVLAASESVGLPDGVNRLKCNKKVP
jgi:subtilisin family serine protease